MRPGHWQLIILLFLVFLFFGGRIISFIRRICGSEPPSSPSPPPPRSPRRERSRKVPASEDVVDAEIIDHRDR